MEKLLWLTNKKWFKNIWYIWRTTTGQGDDYTTGCLLDYPYFKGNYQLITVDLSVQKVLDPKTMQQINFTGNLERDENTQMFFIIDETNETVLDFLKEPVRVL